MLGIEPNYIARIRNPALRHTSQTALHLTYDTFIYLTLKLLSNPTLTLTLRSLRSAFLQFKTPTESIEIRALTVILRFAATKLIHLSD